MKRKNIEKKVITESIMDASAIKVMEGLRILSPKKINIIKPVKTIRIPDMKLDIVLDIFI